MRGRSHVIDARNALDALLSHPPNTTEARDALASKHLTANDLEEIRYAAARLSELADQEAQDRAEEELR